MSVKISIFKSTADGEQCNIEYNLESKDYKELEPHKEKATVEGQTYIVEKPGKSLRQVFSPYFRLVDDRLLEMNTRIAVANTMVKKLPVEAQMAFHNVMEVLHGQAPTTPEAREILKDSVRQVTERLLQQGVHPERVKEAVEQSYPGLTMEPEPASNPLQAEENKSEPHEAP